MDYIAENFAVSEDNFKVEKMYPESTGETIETEPEVIAKLHNHKLALESWGIKEVGSLGKLSISGNIITQPGILAPWRRGSPGGSNPKTELGMIPSTMEVEIDSKEAGMIERSFHHTYRINPTTANRKGDSVAFEKIGGNGYRLETIELSSALQDTVPIHTACWVGSEIELADKTNILIKQPNRFLVFIANKLKVGKNITLTWERGIRVVEPQLPKPAKKPTPPISQEFSDGVNGDPEDTGICGTGGNYLKDALEVEICVVQMKDSPTSDLRGGDGSTGQQGQDGGDGRTGLAGTRSNGNRIWCDQGPGNRGRLSLFTPQPIVNAYIGGGFFVTVDGGAPGQWGVRYDDAITLKTVSEEDFMKELTKPAIISLSSNQAKEGDTISVSGQRFSKSDFVMLHNKNCLTTFISDTLLTFTVPPVEGGRKAVQVSRGEGVGATLSNKVTLDVMPVIHSHKPSGKVKPNSVVTLMGTGFADGAKIQANGQDMPDVNFVDLNTIQFKMIRPEVVTPNSAGERVSVKVILREGETSNRIEVVMGTFVLLVLGDSIHWGEGLQDEEKFHSIVRKEISNRLGNIGVYKDVQAHCGAEIGLAFKTDEENTNICDPVKEDGEVPTSHPTILQQVDNYTKPPEEVDLILINGGINDIGIFGNIVTPLREDPPLQDLVESHCHQHMKVLLNKITKKFTKANIVVTGYYKILSQDSFTNLNPLTIIEQFIIALGGVVGGKIGKSVAAMVVNAAEKEIIRKSNFFWTESNAKLQQAVDEVNDEVKAQFGGTTRIFFAQPQFQDDNAVFTSHPLVFSLNNDLSPQDTMKGSRFPVCEIATRHECGGSKRTGEAFCKRASAGHPNAEGAKRYADAILKTEALTF